MGVVGGKCLLITFCEFENWRRRMGIVVYLCTFMVLVNAKEPERPPPRLQYLLPSYDSTENSPPSKLQYLLPSFDTKEESPPPKLQYLLPSFDTKEDSPPSKLQYLLPSFDAKEESPP